MAVILLGVALAAVGTRAGVHVLDKGGDGSTRAGAVESAAATGPTDPRYPDQASRDGAGRAPDLGVNPETAASTTAPPQSAPPTSSAPAPPTESTGAAASPPPSRPATSPSSAATTAKTSARPTTASPTKTASATATGAAAYEDQVLTLVNNERAAAGCGPVKADVPLRDLARAFSKDMADRGYFSHNTPEGKTPWDRAEAAGITYLAAENIARGQQTPAAVMTAWMNSEGHRRNILNCGLTKLGVGVQMGSGGPWWTQEFGR
ncbi:CAP domain-containing protein [Yinghuangia sp. ASG 101]|uniref:CAP domain-containing protein n=1 Tax=Yinghuangia sp. ASG 101 TaxID=2896848 RepID=UPI001E4C6043|nr:CAP domain-containing protein [Yinghuangia sp. ASG 101]UGQ14134.1 CAP domain-containing protein [Yinghuangia sp. ASG 101]